MTRIVATICVVILWTASVGASVCGDSTIEGGEVCDPPFEGAGCAGGDICNDTCSGCVDQSLCGNRSSDPGEACDPAGALRALPRRPRLQRVLHQLRGAGLWERGGRGERGMRCAERLRGRLRL